MPFRLQTGRCTLVWLDQLKESNKRLTRWSLALQPHQFTVTYHSSGGNNTDERHKWIKHDRSCVTGEGEECEAVTL